MSLERPKLKLYDPKQRAADASLPAMSSEERTASLNDTSRGGITLKIYSPDMCDGIFGEQTARFKTSLAAIEANNRSLVAEIELTEGSSLRCELKEGKSFLIHRENDGGFAITIPDKRPGGFLRLLQPRNQDVRALFTPSGELVAVYAGGKLEADAERVVEEVDKLIAQRLAEYSDEACFGDRVQRTVLK